MENIEKVGNKVQNFITEAYMPDKSFDTVELNKILESNKWVVLFFWPLDFTFVCPTELKSISDNIKKFDREDAVVLGISTDSKFSHKAWCELDINNGGLGEMNFPMLEDTSHTISKQFGVLIEEKGISLRGTFIISPDGILENATINNTSVGRNVDEILRTLAAFKTGGLCPMNWQEGEDTL